MRRWLPVCRIRSMYSNFTYPDPLSAFHVRLSLSMLKVVVRNNARFFPSRVIAVTNLRRARLTIAGTSRTEIVPTKRGHRNQHDIFGYQPDQKGEAETGN